MAGWLSIPTQTAPSVAGTFMAMWRRFGSQNSDNYREWKSLFE